MPKIIHYRNRCIGCGICQQRQPEHWRMSHKDGKAVLVKGTRKNEVFVLPIPELQQEHSLSVAAACPVRVIKITP